MRRPPPPHAPPRPRADDETKVCGLNASLSVFRVHPESIIRVYLTEDRLKLLGELLHYCAQHKKAYHVVGDEELARVSGSSHHEGVCILRKDLPSRTLGDLLRDLRRTDAPARLVLLEDVTNPHNLGAILRVCAHFGARDVLVSGQTPATLSAAATRTAEGGAEHVSLIHLQEPLLSLPTLKKDGFTLLAASQRAPVSIFSQALPRRVIFLFGSETHGLSAALQGMSDGSIQVPGTGAVESLNVACAVTAVLAEAWRQHPGPPPT